MNTPETTNTAPAAGGLESLAAEAQTALSAPAESQQPGAAQPAGETKPPQPSNTELIEGAVTMARDLFCSITQLKSPQVTLADTQVKTLAAAWGAVCDKRQINLFDYMGDYALEIAAAVSTIAVAAAMRAGIIAELAERKAKEKPAETEASPAGTEVKDLDAGGQQ